MTAPPVPADVVPWPDVVWSTADVTGGGPAGDPAGGEMVAAVTAGPDGFVAVGYRERDAVRDGLIWFSEDGVSWTSVGAPGAFDAVELVDVATSPRGFVALGVGLLGPAADRPHAVFLRSPDGVSWDASGRCPDPRDTYPAWVDRRSRRGRRRPAVMRTALRAVWRSLDGMTFERMTIELAADLSVTDPHAVDDGYVALGGSGSPPVHAAIARWGALDRHAHRRCHRRLRSTVGPGSMGIGRPGGAGHRPARRTRPARPASIAWWSEDGSAWGRLPGDGSPISNGRQHRRPGRRHTASWRSTARVPGRALTAGRGVRSPSPGDGSMLITDAVVVGDEIVAVGAVYGEDGISRGAIVVASSVGARRPRG